MIVGLRSSVSARMLVCDISLVLLDFTIVDHRAARLLSRRYLGEIIDR